MDDLRHRFTHHAPVGNQSAAYAEIRAEALELAVAIDTAAPDGREKSLAITKLEEAVMWANASIARHGLR